MKRYIPLFILLTSVHFANAGVTSTWNVASGAWTDTGSWDNSIVPTNGDVAVFIVGASLTNTATSVPGIIHPEVRLSGDGKMIFNRSGSMEFNAGFTATGNISLDCFLIRPDETCIWNSSGILSTGSSDPSMYFNYMTGDTIFNQLQGTVKIVGNKFFRRSWDNYNLIGGELQTSDLFGNEGYLHNDLNILGGTLTQTGDMRLSNSDINFSDGVFRIQSGKLTTFGAGKLNFSTNSTGIFYSTNSIAEIDAFINATNITIGGQAVTSDDKRWQSKGSDFNIKLHMIPPSRTVIIFR